MSAVPVSSFPNLIPHPPYIWETSKPYAKSVTPDSPWAQPSSVALMDGCLSLQVSGCYFIFCALLSVSSWDLVSFLLGHRLLLVIQSVNIHSKGNSITNGPDYTWLFSNKISTLIRAKTPDESLATRRQFMISQVGSMT